jgi:choline-sulfatase
MRPILFALSLFAATATAKPPNVLFILVDDQSPFSLRAYDPAAATRTPELDKLAARGVVLDAAYHMGSNSGAVCSPSRHMIMTGRTLWHLPTAPWAEKTCPPDIAQQTIPVVFRRAGYATMRTCKMGNSYEAANQLFEVRRDATKRGPTDESGSAWHAEQVLDYLNEKQAARDERPFFIFFGFSHPHDERDGKPELLAHYGATNHNDQERPPALHPDMPPLPPNYLPAHPFPNTHDDVRDEVAVPGVWRRRDEATVRNEIGRECACSENIDIQIGRVLRRLEELGELENTFIIYTSDHGMSVGRHGLMGKQNLYEHTWRVPLIAAGPGLPTGRRAAGNVYLLDLLPTFCDLTGVPAPETVQGVSFKPVLTGEAEQTRDILYGAYCGGAKPGMRAVRRGDWKLIQYETANGAVRRSQLFNLRDNPHELLAEHHAGQVSALTGHKAQPGQTDLAADPAHAATLAEMRALLLEQMRAHEDPWRFSDQPDDALPEPPAPVRRAKGKGKGK